MNNILTGSIGRDEYSTGYIRFEFHGDPVPCIVNIGSVNVYDGADVAISLLTLQRSSETVGAGITEQVESLRRVDICVLIRKDKDKWGYELHEESADDVFHCKSKVEPSVLFKRGRSRAYAPG